VLDDNLQSNEVFFKPIDKKQLIQNQCVNILIMFSYFYLI